jgi:uncharacterized protein YbaR (Trm112 family)
MQPKNLDLFICPQCSGKLQPDPAGSQWLDCQNCPLSYPVRSDVPVLLIKEARARPIETSSEFERLIIEALQAPFSGWDFSWLQGRRVEIPDPRGDIDLAYSRRARERIAEAYAVLDLGTGGGEVLSRLAPFPKVVVATEAYPPNVTEAARRLTPFGVQVIWTDGACADSRGPQPHHQWPHRRLPFAGATFDLVLARSSSFCPGEVYRVLKPGGTLLTLQGGTQKDNPDKDGPGLAQLLEGTPPEWTQPGYSWDIDATLDKAGFMTVEKMERRVTTIYRDIGAVVYFLKAVPWVIIDFEVNRYRQRLYKLHQRMQTTGDLTTSGSERLIEVRKPWHLGFEQE